MRRRLITILTAAALLASLAGATALAQPFQQHPPQKYVTPLQAAEAIAGGENIFLLDVRNGWEYSDYHIPGAANIPVQVLANPENLARIPKGKKIVVYCRTGVRADRALSILKANGIDAVNIRGGVVAWWRDVLSPPSNTMAPYGRMKPAYRKRQKLRKYFLSAPPN